MFLSCLQINIGNDPNRPQPGRDWLRNLYHVHQRLCMAFPSDPRKERDPDFLAPYAPEDFGLVKDHEQVHVPRKENAGFLFRIDPHAGGGVGILVQSIVKPDWDYAFHNARYLISDTPMLKPFNPKFEMNQSLEFRLVANPTMKFDTLTKKERMKYTKEEFKKIEGRNGKRLPVPACQLYDWLSRKAAVAGFSITKDSINIQTGYIYIQKRDEKMKRLRSVRYDGILKVINPDSFEKTLSAGIGPAKAFGFGLLSVAPAARRQSCSG